MVQRCQNPEACLNKTCIEQETCAHAAYWVKYWQEKQLVPYGNKNSQQKKVVQNIKVDKLTGPTIVGKIVLPTNARPKKIKKKRHYTNLHSWPKRQCLQIKNGKCDRRSVCGILGQCLFEHPLTLTRPDLVDELRKVSGVKNVVKILEEIMPGLRRFQGRAGYRPDDRQ